MRRIEDMKEERMRAADSLTAVRKRQADSVMAVRSRYSDSIRRYNDSIQSDRMQRLAKEKEERKRASDSLATIRAYRLSKEYKDSIAAERQKNRDSLAHERKLVSDSIKGRQVAYRDSLKAVQKEYTDSLKAALDSAKTVRMQVLDSLTTARQLRSDSLAKVKAAREELRKQKADEKEKEKRDKLKLALEVKFKKKQETYTNETMKKKKWTLPRKVVQNTFTRYNYYFNADRKMDEAIDNMLRSKTDNYDSTLALFPFDPDVDSAKLASDMDTIIRKASVGIQIHDPRAKWQDDLYLLVGQAYYYKGDYQNAGAAFRHIVSMAEEEKKEQQKKKSPKEKAAERTKPVNFGESEKTGIAGWIEHKPAKNEAMLWLSRTLAQSKKKGQAQTLLDMLRNDAAFPERLKGRLALEQAFVDLKSGDATAALPSLMMVADDKELPKWLRLRSGFLAGQLLQQQRRYQESDRYLAQVLSLNPHLEMDFYARKYMASNGLYSGSNTNGTTEMLEKMAKDAKYKPYHDQVYFAMGKLAVKNKQPAKALESFLKSLSASQSNKKQKGLSYAAVGDEYYKANKYREAKNYYDSAAGLLTADQEPAYSIALQRAAALDKVAGPAQAVQEQDSLLALAALPEKEQRAVIKNYLKELEKKMRDSIFRAANSDQVAASGNTLPTNNKNTTWYFGNPGMMKKGENEFKQRWGNRVLKDNWRRSGLSMADMDMPEHKESEEGELDLPNADSLFAAIPKGEAAIQASRDLLRKAMFQLGKAYYSPVEDYAQALEIFDTLDARFPKHEFGDEELYLRYLIKMRQHLSAEASAYRERLQQEYPASEWTKLLKGQAAQQDEGIPDIYANANNVPKETISRHYEETYGLLMQRQFDKVLDRVAQANEQYKDQGPFRKKYELVYAIAKAGSGKVMEADTLLSRFITSNLSDSGLSSWAQSVLNFIRTQQWANSDHGPASRIQKGQEAALPAAVQQMEYVYKPNEKHFVLIAAVQDARFAGLRSGLSDYNQMKMGKEHLVVNMSTLDDRTSVIICKTFDNAKEAKKYAGEIKNEKLLFREYPSNDYEIVLISEENFPQLFLKRDWDTYKAFYKKNYK